MPSNVPKSERKSKFSTPIHQVIVPEKSINQEPVDKLVQNNDQIKESSTIFLKKYSFNENSVEQETCNSSAQDSKEIKRKPLPLFVFILIILIESCFTFYPSLTFTRNNGQYQFILQCSAFLIIFTAVSIYIRSTIKKLLLLYFLLDPLLIISVCLSGTYIFPFYAISRTSFVEMAEIVLFVICNFTMIGNFRMMLTHLEWTKFLVVTYKMTKIIWILFYLVFGAYYILGDISYSKGSDDDKDDKIRQLVILFVFSGFALQLEVYNRVSDFDGTSQLKTSYLIATVKENCQCQNNENKSNESIKQNQIINAYDYTIQEKKLKYNRNRNQSPFDVENRFNHFNKEDN